MHTITISKKDVDIIEIGLRMVSRSNRNLAEFLMRTGLKAEAEKNIKMANRADELVEGIKIAKIVQIGVIPAEE